MIRSTSRRLGAVTASLVLLTGMVGSGVAAADAPSRAASWSSDTAGEIDASRRASVQDDPIQVRDLRFSCPEDRVPETQFVDSGEVYERAIDCLVWYGITEGRTPTTFDPNRTVDRRQMAVFLHRMLDDILELPAYGGTSTFDDVPDEGFGSAEINVLASDELVELLDVRVVSGRSEGVFDPRSPVTREQMGSFMARTLQGIANAQGGRIEPGSCGSEACFPDAERIAPAHRDNVELLYQFGIVTGRSNGNYDPKGEVIRGQMALFLTRTLDVVVQAGGTVPPDRRG